MNLQNYIPWMCFHQYIKFNLYDYQMLYLISWNPILTYRYPFTLCDFLWAVFYFCGQCFHQTNKIPIRAAESEVVLVTEAENRHKLRLYPSLLHNLAPRRHRQVLTWQQRQPSCYSKKDKYITQLTETAIFFIF